MTDNVRPLFPSRALVDTLRDSAPPLTYAQIGRARVAYAEAEIDAEERAQAATDLAIFVGHWQGNDPPDELPPGIDGISHAPDFIPSLTSWLARVDRGSDQ